MKRRWELYEQQEERKKLLQAARNGKRGAQRELLDEFRARVYSPAERTSIDVAKLLKALAAKADDLPGHHH